MSAPWRSRKKDASKEDFEHGGEDVEAVEAVVDLDPYCSWMRCTVVLRPATFQLRINMLLVVKLGGVVIVFVFVWSLAHYFAVFLLFIVCHLLLFLFLSGR